MSTSPYRRLLAEIVPAVPENAVGRTKSTSDIPIAWKLDLCPKREVRRLGYDVDLMPELADGFRQFVGEVDKEVGGRWAPRFPGSPGPPAGRRSDSVENGSAMYSVQDAFRGFQLLFLAIFDDLKNRHPACSTLRARSYYLSHRSHGLDDVQLHLWSPSFPKAEIPVLQWSYEDSEVLDEGAPLVEELSRSWTPVSISRGLPSPYRPISKAMYWTSHKDGVPAYFVTSYKQTMLFRRRGSTLYATPVISAGCSTSSGLVPCIMGLIFSRCAEVGLLDYYPSPPSIPIHQYHSTVPKAAATGLIPFSTCSAASQLPCGTTHSLSLGFGDEDPHSLKNAYDLNWLTSPNRNFGAGNARSIACSSRLGFGHMGNVYRGVTDTGLEVAVKIVSGKENRAALRHEWEIYATLMGFGATGETIPFCHGFAESGGPEDGSGFSVLVLECIGDGKPAVDDFCQLPPKEREYLFHAMRDLHNLGFINRDLTSRNVVRDKRGRLRIIDLEHVRHHKCHLDGPGFGQRRESVLNCEDFSCTVVRLGVDDL